MPTPAKKAGISPSPTTIEEGFPGQRLRVLPRPVVNGALKEPITGLLMVTDCGFYPHAAAHGMTRRTGCDQAIVMVCVEGLGWVRTPSGTRVVGPSEVAVIPPGCPHAYGADGNDPWSIWWVHLQGSQTTELLRLLEVDGDCEVLPVRDVYRLADQVDEAITWLEQDDSPANVTAAAGVGWTFMTTLVAARHRVAGHTDTVAQAQAYLRRRPERRVRVADLAAHAGISPSHFAALFKKATGYGVLEYQVRLRLSRAQTLLDTTSLSIAEVAAATGYQDPLYFSRQFRSVHHVSPSEYRASRKG